MTDADLPTLGALVDDIEKPGKGLIMFMGKGGVGKTTMAAAVAAELAARGHEVLLSTTDPAAHITETLAGGLNGLTVSRIDPAQETARYRDHVMATKGKGLDEQASAMLEEDLRSPCTEEIAVFQAFSRVIRESSKHFVVMDTAPTGHTLLLLDATGSYHRDIMRHKGDMPGKMVTPMMRLQDPAQTKIMIVTLPETTPVLEAAHPAERSATRWHRALRVDHQFQSCGGADASAAIAKAWPSPNGNKSPKSAMNFPDDTRW